MKVIGVDELVGPVVSHYRSAHLPAGVSTGLPNMDPLWRIEKGALNIVTGIPGAGKSEVMDQVIVNTIRQHNWSWVVFSPESWPLANHTGKLLEKWEGRGFGGNPHTRMTESEVIGATQQIGQSVRFLEPDETEPITFEWLFNGFDKAYKAFQFDALLLDPMNEVEHRRPRGVSETEYIGMILTEFRNWGRRHNVSIVIVAHPQKLLRDKDGNYPIPTPYDINGSANYRNKCDVCLTMWRDYSEGSEVPVQLHIQKMRNSRAGALGCAEMFWSYTTGCYYETEYDRTDAETIAYRNMETI
jgi:twinkle protein